MCDLEAKIDSIECTGCKLWVHFKCVPDLRADDVPAYTASDDKFYCSKFVGMSNECRFDFKTSLTMRYVEMSMQSNK